MILQQISANIWAVKHVRNLFRTDEKKIIGSWESYIYLCCYCEVETTHNILLCDNPGMRVSFADVIKEIRTALLGVDMDTKLLKYSISYC